MKIAIKQHPKIELKPIKMNCDPLFLQLSYPLHIIQGKGNNK